MGSAFIRVLRVNGETGLAFAGRRCCLGCRAEPLAVDREPRAWCASPAETPLSYGRSAPRRAPRIISVHPDWWMNQAVPYRCRDFRHGSGPARRGIQTGRSKGIPSMPAMKTFRPEGAAPRAPRSGHPGAGVAGAARLPLLLVLGRAGSGWQRASPRPGARRRCRLHLPRAGRRTSRDRRCAARAATDPVAASRPYRAGTDARPARDRRRCPARAEAGRPAFPSARACLQPVRVRQRPVAAGRGQRRRAAHHWPAAAAGPYRHGLSRRTSGTSPSTGSTAPAGPTSCGWWTWPRVLPADWQRISIR